MARTYPIPDFDQQRVKFGEGLVFNFENMGVRSEHTYGGKPTTVYVEFQFRLTHENSILERLTNGFRFPRILVKYKGDKITLDGCILSSFEYSYGANHPLEKLLYLRIEARNVEVK